MCVTLLIIAVKTVVWKKSDWVGRQNSSEWLWRWKLVFSFLSHWEEFEACPSASLWSSLWASQHSSWRVEDLIHSSRRCPNHSRVSLWLVLHDFILNNFSTVSISFNFLILHWQKEQIKEILVHRFLFEI